MMDTKALKDKILQLAIQGKLVPQNENDEPASVLLEKIKAEKERLIKDKVIKKEKQLPEISDDEKLFDLPNGWEWCRLGELGICQTGTTPSTNIEEYFGGKIPFIKPADIDSKKIDYENDSLTSLGLKKGRKIPENSLLMVCIGGSIGKNYFTDRICSCNQQINALTPLQNINSKLLHYICSSQFLYNKLIETATGTATPIIKKSNWEQLIIPLPPLEEQKRIVAKVDSLFKLIDELDNNKQDLLQNISDTRNKVLQLAIQGKLVSQDENDESASILLKKIKEEKERLIKEKVIKKEKPLAEISDDEKLFDLPNGWEWVRLGSIIINHDSKRKPVSVKDREKLNKIYDYYGATGPIDKVDNYIFDGFYLLIGEDGGNFFTERNVAFTVHGKFWANNHVHVLEGIDDITINYLKYFLNSLNLKELGIITGIAVPKLNQANLNNIIISLPPLEEQKRIVDKVDTIMNYLDELEKQIN